MKGVRYTNSQIEAAIRGSGGVIGKIARTLGAEWHTVRRRIDASPHLMELWRNECELVDDMAESVLLKSIQDGDIGSAKWWLERRRRGQYATRQEIAGADGGPVSIRLLWGENDDGDA